MVDSWVQGGLILRAVEIRKMKPVQKYVTVVKNNSLDQPGGNRGLVVGENGDKWILAYSQESDRYRWEWPKDHCVVVEA